MDNMEIELKKETIQYMQTPGDKLMNNEGVNEEINRL